MDHPISFAGLEPSQLRDSYTTPPQQESKGYSIDDVAACASPGDFVSSSAKAGKRRKQGRGSESIGAMLRRGIVEHQLGLSVNLMLLVALTYVLFPSLRDRMKAFFWLSYPKDGVWFWYGQGPRDLYLVATFVVFFTAVRAFCLDYVLLPLAGACGISTRKGRVRFAEQSYMLLYYTLYWFWGLSLFIRNTPSHSVHSLNDLLISMWTEYPRLYLGAGMKLYYLSQLAFWIQQIAVIHLEEKRKDHYQMLTHHFITVCLLGLSYPYRQWRVGNAILVCMDIVDLVFPLAKILRYLSLQTACDVAFAVFVIVWLLARHIAYLAICWSIYAHVAVVTMPYGLYSTKTGLQLNSDGGDNVLHNVLQPFLHPEAQTVRFNARIRWLFLALLLALQCVTIAWFVMICRVAIRVIRGEGADDSRSDGEDELEIGEEDEELTVDAVTDGMSALPSAPFTAHSNGTGAEKEKPQFIEVESTSDDVHFASHARRKEGLNPSGKRKSKGGISSGLHLGEHKEILNRIGCLSEEQLAREREKREGGENGSPRPGSGGKR